MDSLKSASNPGRVLMIFVLTHSFFTIRNKRCRLKSWHVEWTMRSSYSIPSIFSIPRLLSGDVGGFQAYKAGEKWWDNLDGGRCSCTAASRS